MAQYGSGVKRTAINLLIRALCLTCILVGAFAAHAQPAPALEQSAQEPSIAAKIAQLKAARRGLEREARETQGYHEAFREMKIVKINKLISRLKSGEDVPEKEIDHTINHMPFPLYKAPSD
jgi:hypothetical protein